MESKANSGSSKEFKSGFKAFKDNKRDVLGSPGGNFVIFRGSADIRRL